MQRKAVTIIILYLCGKMDIMSNKLESAAVIHIFLDAGKVGSFKATQELIAIIKSVKPDVIVTHHARR